MHIDGNISKLYAYKLAAVHPMSDSKRIMDSDFSVFLTRYCIIYFWTLVLMHIDGNISKRYAYKLAAVRVQMYIQCQTAN